MNEAWTIVVAVGLGTMAIKASGPVVLGGRRLPRGVASLVAMLAPALLAALVVTAGVSTGATLVADARLIGLGAACLALALRAPILVVVIVAAAAAAIARPAGIA